MPKRTPLGNELLGKLKGFKDFLETAEEKNNLLKTVVSKVTYLKTEKALKKNADPTNFIINIYPKINKLEV